MRSGKERVRLGGKKEIKRVSEGGMRRSRSIWRGDGARRNRSERGNESEWEGESVWVERVNGCDSERGIESDREREGI